MANELNQIFLYGGSPVSFKKGDSVMVNATEMAKPFGKRPNDYLSLPSTNELLNAITRKSGISVNQLITTKPGSPQNGGGTWMHEDVALDFAQWLSVDFRLWVNDKIKELLTSGHCSIKQQYQIPQSYSEALMLAAKQAEQIEQANRTINRLQPKADFADAAFQAEGKVDIGQAAKILGLPFGRNTLFKKLKEKGIFFVNRNEPKQKYIDAKYFELTQLPPIHRHNHPDIITMKVICTQKGLAFINHLFGGNPPDGKLSAIK